MTRLLMRLVVAAAFAIVTCAFASASTIMVLSDSAGVYLIDSATGKVVQSYGNLFSGSSAQDVAEDLNGNLYVTDSSGNLRKATFNANAGSSTGAYAAATVVGAIPGYTSAVARLAWDPTTLYCATGCLVTMNSSGNSLDWINPATAAIVKSVAVSPAISGGGDLVIDPTAVNNAAVYVVSGKAFYSVNPSTGASTSIATFSWPGLTANLTGLALLANGDLVGCEQKGSGTAWTLWEFTTAGALVTSQTGISTGSDVVNDLASVPATFTTSKTGTANAGLGDTMIYTVTLKNTSYFTVPTAAMTDPYPSTISVLSSPAPSCSVSGGGSCTATLNPSASPSPDVVASVTNLAAGATATMTFEGSPSASASGTVSNTANSSVPFDPNEYGGSTAATNTINTTITASEFAKQVANITEGLAPGTSLIGKPGDVVEYTLTFTNRRGFSLASFQINDPVPTGTTYVANSATCISQPAGLTCAPSQSGGVVSFVYTGTSLAANGVVSAKFRVTIN